jgi:glucoamylase
MQAPNSNNAHPTWASARKDMVGSSLGPSRIWFTLAQGIVTEVFHPRIDIPQIKDLGFIVADGKGFWVEVRRLESYEVTQPEAGGSSVEVVHRHPRFTLTLRVCPAHRRDVLLIHCKLEGEEALRPYALLSPRLGGELRGNSAWVVRQSARTILSAEQGVFGLALAAVDAQGADAWGRCSVGSAEVSDGWQDFSRNGCMTWEYDAAGPGAVALIGELPREATLALGIGTSKEAAATLAISELMADFGAAWDADIAAWRAWRAKSHHLAVDDDMHRALASSSAVLKVHQDLTYRGATVASLSVPWGDSSDTLGGYHLVWPRDLVETAGALVVMENFEEARDVLRYLIATQQDDGHWLQNQWLGGKPFWQGEQLDETGFPVLLASALRARGELGSIPAQDAIERALSFIAINGPATAQDRWEEDAGINVFTLAVAISALVEGSAFLTGEAKLLALRLADCWNANLEDWSFVADTPLARAADASGYYVRTMPADVLTRDRAPLETVAIKNLAQDPNLPANAQIATDFLQLVRYGLRRPDDRWVVDTLKVVDRLLKVDTPSGPVWRRYNDDGYGEHEDGSPFDGTGRGRGWPLLTGERGHYAAAAGEDVTPYIKAMIAMSSPLGLIPEQVWDSPPIAEFDLKPGRPSGSAMPLVWAHAEFIKLCHSQKLGAPVDRPAETWKRYGGVRPTIDYVIWGPKYRPRRIRAGHRLTIALAAAARVHWGVNGWSNLRDADTADVGLRVHTVDLAIANLAAGDTIQFTFRWRESNVWEGGNYEILVVE